MIFNSLTFLVFFAVCLALYALPLKWTVHKGILLIASYLFYMAWNPPFVLLLLISTGVDWWAANRIARAESQNMRKLFLACSLGVNLGFLFFFKYSPMLMETLNGMLGFIGVEMVLPRWSIILPMGISFYTFQTLSYTLDVYRKRELPSDSMLDFALYVTFFPQLVAGPIVRSNEFLPQLQERPEIRPAMISWGIVLIVFGLFEKIVLADTIMAPVADTVFGASGEAGFRSAWMGVLAFTGQIYFDFAGYSTCAIGIAMLMGFELPDNFRAPYGAMGFGDFWQRWHISLSSWLRDYLYIPLGGNKKGNGRTYTNLFITMLLGGLWHGANWTFVVWGGLHGAYLAIERPFRKKLESAAARSLFFRIGWMLATLFLVMLAWVPFRAASFGDCSILFQAMFGFADGNLSVHWFSECMVVGLAGVMFVLHGLMKNHRLEHIGRKMPMLLVAASVVFMVLMIIMSPVSDRAFIYFQF
ncbi:MBOAT family protein [Verrucomicrobia bacterium S94]|nr:MBOAT family protein [Verrucomicrobia bacterium S94]